MSDTDACLRWSKKKAAGYANLPSRIRTKIVEYVINDPDIYQVDLDTRKSFKELCGIIYICRETHRSHLQTYFISHVFTISMHTSDIKVNLEFERLQYLMYTYLGRLWAPPCALKRFGATAKFVVDLRIYADSRKLEDIRIKALSLVAATFVADGSSEIAITLHTKTTEEHHTFAITDLHTTPLQYFEQSEIEDGVCFREFCPAMWDR